MRLWRSRPDSYFLFSETIYSLPCGERERTLTSSPARDKDGSGLAAGSGEVKTAGGVILRYEGYGRNIELGDDKKKVSSGCPQRN